MNQQVQLPARFANRQNRRNLVASVSAGLGTASPPHISIMGGAFTLVDANGEEKPVETRFLDCVIIDTQRPDQGEAAISRVFWGLDDKNQPKGWDQGSKLPPTCWSDNGVGASSSATEPQSTSCQTCPMARFDWVSKRDPGKRTAACNKIKKIALVPLELQMDAKGVPVYREGGETLAQHIEKFPFVLRVPVMSHEGLRAYSTKFAGQNFDVSEVVTRISFVHGQVGQLAFDTVGFTDAAVEQAVQGFLDARLTDVLVGRGDKAIAALPAPQQERATTASPALAAPYTGPAVQGDPYKVLANAAAQQAPAEEAPKRTRKKAEPAPAVAQPVDQSGIPPFLRVPQAQTVAAPNHGIQQAPPPNAELESALANVFGLKT